MEPCRRETVEKGIDLADLWRGLVSGHFFLSSSYYRAGRCYTILRKSERTSRRPSPTAVRVLERVLAGESQKLLACELGLTSPTIASYCSGALRGVAYERLSSRAPIVVVMAALAARGVALPEARLEETLEDGSWVISVETPGRSYATKLSPGEWEVARATIEGKTHAEIARARGTSRRTIANQLASVFSKLRAFGRSELRAKAVVDCSLAVAE